MHYTNVVVAWTLQAHDALTAAAASLDSDMRELAALTLVQEHQGCSVEWLRARVGLTQSGTVRLVDRLQDQGLVERHAAAGRGVALRTTALAAERLASWRASRERVVDALLEHVDAAQHSALVEALAAALRGDERSRTDADRACRTCSWSDCGAQCPVDESVKDRA